jgi:hypothetical protein
MKASLIALAAVAALVAEGPAYAGTCSIQSNRAPGEWTFVRVYDVDSGKIVLQRAVKGGTPYEVKVSKERIRVDSKLPGGLTYAAGKVSACKDGNKISI